MFTGTEEKIYAEPWKEVSHVSLLLSITSPQQERWLGGELYSSRVMIWVRIRKEKRAKYCNSSISVFFGGNGGHLTTEVVSTQQQAASTWSSHWLLSKNNLCLSNQLRLLPSLSVLTYFLSTVLQRNRSSPPSSRPNIQPHLWLGLSRRRPHLNTHLSHARYQYHNNGPFSVTKLQAPHLLSSQCNWQRETSTLHPRWRLGPRFHRSRRHHRSHHCQVR